MNFISIEISIAAMIPTLILAAYIFLNDKIEKEPIRLLIILFVIGGLAYFPAYYVEKAAVGFVDDMFSGMATYNLHGIPTYDSAIAMYGHGFLVVFIGVALIEEVFKWLVMFFITFKNKNFNCLFDGIVYATFVSLGFAMVENVRYAWLGGWDTLLLRAITTVPGHLYFGFIMGYCYTMWRAYKSAARAEQEYQNRGLIKIVKPFRTFGWFTCMIILPILEHGIYGFAGYFHTRVFDLIFYILNAVLFVACMIGVRKVSQVDAYRGRYADVLVDKKYPEIKDLYDDVEKIVEEEIDADIEVEKNE